MMTHTKGPWEIDDATLLDSEGTRCINVYGTEGQGYGRVAVVYAECGRYDDLLPNARLIASAPELLALLEDYYKACCGDGGNYFKPDGEFIKETAEAIRKAKGD